MNIVFFGDSICVGQGMSIHKGWVPRLAVYFDDIKRSSASPLIVNSSRNGRTTRQALEDMPYEIQSAAPDIFVVQFGMNDSNFWESDKGLPRVSIDAFKYNLIEIVNRAIHFGARRVVLNSNHPTTKLVYHKYVSPDSYIENNRLYNQAIREVAALLHSEVGDVICFIDIEDKFDVVTGEGLEVYLLSDGVHLSERGHDVYFDALSPVLAALYIDLLAEDE